MKFQVTSKVLSVEFTQENFIAELVDFRLKCRKGLAEPPFKLPDIVEVHFDLTKIHFIDSRSMDPLISVINKLRRYKYRVTGAIASRTTHGIFKLVRMSEIMDYQYHESPSS